MPTENAFAEIQVTSMGGFLILALENS